MEVVWTENAAEDIKFWKKQDPKTIKRIKSLIENIKVTPYSGIGKPEPLKYGLQGCWTRRITGAHRIVYKVRDKEIVILQCRHHYL